MRKRLSILACALALGGCQAVSVNGVRVQRATALTVVGAVGVGVILAKRRGHKPADKPEGFACPGCPPTTKEELAEARR